MFIIKNGSKCSFQFLLIDNKKINPLMELFTIFHKYNKKGKTAIFKHQTDSIGEI